MSGRGNGLQIEVDCPVAQHVTAELDIDEDPIDDLALTVGHVDSPRRAAATAIEHPGGEVAILLILDIDLMIVALRVEQIDEGRGSGIE